MRFDLQQLQTEILPLADVHGLDIVAIEWLQGPGRGVLRVYIDRPGGDPMIAAAPGYEGATADLCASLSRDVSAALDALDLIPGAYDLEVTSLGFERPVQKRVDFDRFVGRLARVKTRSAVAGRLSFMGPIAGTTDLPGGGFAVRITADGKDVEIPVEVVSRAHLVEVKAPPSPKPGKGPGKHRQRSMGASQGATSSDPLATSTERNTPPEREDCSAVEAER